MELSNRNTTKKGELTSGWIKKIIKTLGKKRGDGGNPLRATTERRREGGRGGERGCKALRGRRRADKRVA